MDVPETPPLKAAAPSGNVMATSAAMNRTRLFLMVHLWKWADMRPQGTSIDPEGKLIAVGAELDPRQRDRKPAASASTGPARSCSGRDRRPLRVPPSCGGGEPREVGGGAGLAHAGATEVERNCMSLVMETN
jgi:hypothetical protein